MIRKIKKNKPRHRDFREIVIEKLQDPAFALEYLNTALEDDDPRVFLLALENVLEAQHEIITKEAEQQTLSKKQLLPIPLIQSTLHTFGLKLATQGDKTNNH